MIYISKSYSRSRIPFLILLSCNLIVCVVVCLPFGGPWKQLGSDIIGTTSVDQSGTAVAMSADGTTIAIGAPGNNNGRVNVYTFVPFINNWIQVGNDIYGKGNGDRFGNAVTMSSDGKTIAIGALYNDNVNGEDSGQVRILTFNSTKSSPVGYWMQIGTDINGKGKNGNAGTCLAMSNNGATIAIGVPYGAPFENDENTAIYGHVRVYSRNFTSKNYTQVGLDINGKAFVDGTGLSVAISADGTTVAVGAPYSNNINGEDSGHVRIYTKNASSSNWTQVGFDIIGEAAFDLSGVSIAMSSDGKTIAIGATNNDNMNGTNSGHVRIYSINSTSGNWTQVGLDIDGEAAGDQSGNSVAISADGKTVAIGAWFNDVNGLFGANGYGSGHVRVYSLNDKSRQWIQVGSDLNGDARDALFGFSIAMSADGKIIAVGAPNSSKNGAASGHVRVYYYEVAPTNVPTKSPTKSPTKHPTKNPTKHPTKSSTTNPTKAPTRNPTPITTNMTPIKAPTKNLTKSPTKTPTRNTTTTGMTPTTTPTQTPSSKNCGLFGFNFFCPRRGECGFWRRLLQLHGC